MMRNIVVISFIAFIFIATVSSGDATSDSDYNKYKQTNISGLNVIAKLKETVERLSNGAGKNIDGSDSVHLKDSVSWEDCGSE